MYIVPEGTQIFPHLNAIVGDEQVAITKLQETRAQVLKKEEYRFSIAHVVVNGNNTEWRACDLNNDPENGNYYVHNHTIGQHEPYSSLSSAKARIEKLKQEFLTSCNLDDYVVVDSLPELYQPPVNPIPSTTL